MCHSKTCIILKTYGETTFNYEIKHNMCTTDK